MIGDRVELVSHVQRAWRDHDRPGLHGPADGVLGGPPQNTRHKGGPTTLVIGSNCTIREGVTMHLAARMRAAARRSWATTATSLPIPTSRMTALSAGMPPWRTSQPWAAMSNSATSSPSATLSAVHQLVEIGHHAFVGGGTVVVGDVMPYGMVAGGAASCAV